MQKKGVLTKILAIAGTALVCFPILAPILLSVAVFMRAPVPVRLSHAG
jgi:hypothetical protein